MSGKNVTEPDQYTEAIHKARATFVHQSVYDPSSQQLIPLHPITSAVQQRFQDLSFLGPGLSPEVAQQIATGQLHPRTRTPFTATSSPGGDYLKATLAAFPVSFVMSSSVSSSSPHTHTLAFRLESPCFVLSLSLSLSLSLFRSHSARARALSVSLAGC